MTPEQLDKIMNLVDAFGVAKAQVATGARLTASREYVAVVQALIEIDSQPTVGTPNPMAAPALWEGEQERPLPHSRACGWKAHGHGTDCSANCPTCGGKPMPEGGQQ